MNKYREPWMLGTRFIDQRSNSKKVLIEVVAKLWQQGSAVAVKLRLCFDFDRAKWVSRYVSFVALRNLVHCDGTETSWREASLKKDRTDSSKSGR